MWLVRNTTPYAAERTWVQDRDANKIWLVVVKATFNLQPDGSTTLADEQVPVHRMPVPSGEPGTSSLRYEGDLMGVKAGTDVLVVGSACAPSGKRVTSIDVRFAVGPVKKHLRVFGDRYWERSFIGGLTISGPEVFESMPITYERAYGGWDRTDPDPTKHRLESRNPVGTGFALNAEHGVGMKLPNVENPEDLIDSWKQRPAPAGTNAVDCAWSPRRELAGTYDAKWREARAPLWAEDFKPQYHNCAPRDQQVAGFLRGGEAVELHNLTASGRVAFQVPKVYPFFETRFGREKVEHRAQLCTITIEPDRSRVTLAWQTSLVCNHRVDELDATFVTEKRFL